MEIDSVSSNSFKMNNNSEKTTVSLYVPVINKSIDEKYIKECFIKKNIGNVYRVDFVINKQKNRREAFIYFSEYSK